MIKFQDYSVSYHSTCSYIIRKLSRHRTVQTCPGETNNSCEHKTCSCRASCQEKHLKFKWIFHFKILYFNNYLFSKHLSIVGISITQIILNLLGRYLEVGTGKESSEIVQESNGLQEGKHAGTSHVLAGLDRLEANKWDLRCQE